MESEIIWGGDPEDARVITRGTATVEGLDAWVQEGLADPRFRAGMRILVDNRQLDWSGMLPDDLHRRIELFAKEAARLGRARAAVVMRSPVDFGIARMEQAYIEINPVLEIEIGVFFSIEDAREWLREEAAPEPGSGTP